MGERQKRGRDERKFDRVPRFGLALPRLRARVDRDLRRKQLGRERVTACAVRLIDLQLFRVGNPRYAKKNGRKKVTCVHKANILKMSDGMFLAIFREVAKDYPEIEADDKIIDNTCMQLVMNPNQFDVMVMQNLYGDILSDLCSGLIGGLGLVPSSNIGSDYAMFEAVHGSAPDIAGKHLANPTAFLWSACMMLEYLGENETASRIRKAVDEVLAEGKHLTRDLHGEASTEEYVDAVIARL